MASQGRKLGCETLSVLINVREGIKGKNRTTRFAALISKISHALVTAEESLTVIGIEDQGLAEAPVPSSAI